jgi:hypothetical protein
MIYHNMNKTDTDFEINNNIVKRHQNITEELTKILEKQNGYEYNKNKTKGRKHFPASFIDFEGYKLKYGGISKKPTISLSSKNIEEQIKDILVTIHMRCNLSNLYNDKTIMKILVDENYLQQEVYLPIDFKNNLIKYDNQRSIKDKFPTLVNMYDVIYTVKTEKPHHYIDPNNNTFCDIILICCKKKIFNIFFDLDDKDHYYFNLEKIRVSEAYFERTYNNTNI